VACIIHFPFSFLSSLVHHRAHHITTRHIAKRGSGKPPTGLDLEFGSELVWVLADRTWSWVDFLFWDFGPASHGTCTWSFWRMTGMAWAWAWERDSVGSQATGQDNKKGRAVGRRQALASAWASAISISIGLFLGHAASSSGYIFWFLVLSLFGLRHLEQFSPLGRFGRPSHSLVGLLARRFAVCGSLPARSACLLGRLACSVLAPSGTAQQHGPVDGRMDGWIAQTATTQQ
jgi:hypothetical protein